MLVNPKLEARPFEVLKFRVGHPRQMLVLSPLCGLNTHYFGSTRICAGDICGACLSGIAAKYAGYVCVLIQSQRQLLRLTQRSAHDGEMASQFVPGRILEVIKVRERRAIECVTLGDSKTFDRTAIVSRIELLSVVARLHGLARVPDGMNYEKATNFVAKAAANACKLAMEGSFA